MNTMLKASLVLLALLGVAGWLLFMRKGGQPVQSKFLPSEHNDKVLFTSGWTDVELEKIISKFQMKYKGRLHSTFSIVPTQIQSNTFVFRFPGDIDPEYFRYLVNYVRYPEDIEEAGRSILVAGKTTLNNQFSLPLPSLVGQKAIIYVPTNDTEFDLVYIRTDRGEVYKDSFVAFSSWKIVNDPRLPPGIENIPWGAP